MVIPVDINIDFLWGNSHFVKSNWSPITYIVGPNGTGKTIFAERLLEEFRIKGQGLRARYFGADRISSLSNKIDTSGYLASDSTRDGLNIGYFEHYKSMADQLGQSIDALIELRNKLDLQIKIESILTDVFHKQLTFRETGGYLNLSLADSKTGNVYDLKKNESHGLKEIITLLTFIYNDEYNCIILDEPELNLHPQYQQFILNEIKKNAGSIEEGKKIFVILTHSPYMLDIGNSRDLLDYIVFHRNTIPTYIEQYNLDAYQMARLDKLLLRLNTNHKTLFFANYPVFVEGYIDQQLLNLIESKRDIPLGAEGVSIIDVGGKDEVDIMYSLCKVLRIEAKAIVDMDSIFDGKMRQTIANCPVSTEFLAKNGQQDLLTTIGILERLLSELVEGVFLISPTSLVSFSDEFISFITALKEVAGEKAILTKRRITLLAIKRIPEEFSRNIGDAFKIKIEQIRALSALVCACFEISNVFILQKGEIENYYNTYNNNQYKINDSKKTEYFVKEYEAISSLSEAQIEERYFPLVSILDKICAKTFIDTKKMTSVKLGDWIHNVQSLFRSNSSLTLENIKTNPRVNWDSFQRIIDVIEFSANKDGFICKFRIHSRLIEGSENSYEFNQNTVASKFSL